MLKLYLDEYIKHINSAKGEGRIYSDKENFKKRILNLFPESVHKADCLIPVISKEVGDYIMSININGTCRSLNNRIRYYKGELCNGTGRLIAVLLEITLLVNLFPDTVIYGLFKN
ncbi:hypothetical protein [Methanosarcina sp.]|uniref:hypothetical protein n=1 Tax=Methanosarcina sp. TaxID=2213 RepID=UPI002ABC066D|nr:hypothetical protein [Methanosarcina sp.]MDY9925692.1 hypothetical protein [Methanosarcina sp.]